MPSDDVPLRELPKIRILLEEMTGFLNSNQFSAFPQNERIILSMLGSTLHEFKESGKIEDIHASCPEVGDELSQLEEEINRLEEEARLSLKTLMEQKFKDDSEPPAVIREFWKKRERERLEAQDQGTIRTSSNPREWFDFAREYHMNQMKPLQEKVSIDFQKSLSENKILLVLIPKTLG